MSVISDVKQKADIASVIGQYIKLTKAGRNLRGLCPFRMIPGIWLWAKERLAYGALG